MPSISKFKFRKNDRVGDPSAETDQFLGTCFIDTGDLDVLKDCQDPRAIVVGRTGSGKSALLCKLRDECEHIIEIDLSALALSYISGSTILTFFEEELGVKLDYFYRFLWRHVFIVELIKKHYHIEDESDRQKWYDRLASTVFNKGRLDAFRYLNQWGKQFWASSEDRIKELKTVIERELSGNTGLNVSQIATIQAGGKLHLSEEQIREIKRRGDEIVNSVQMSKLSALLDALDEDILTDPKRRYYIVVDYLDEAWVDERLRSWLIRGLIETVRDFNRKGHNAKVIIALRIDLLRRVYKATSDAKFQEEKYEAYNLELRWNREQLRDLLDIRVQELVRRRYTKEPVRLSDILRGTVSKSKGGQTAIDYLLDRTLLRPRDAIQFLNACLEQAIEEPAITIKMLFQAEAKYSQQRRTAVADEWSDHYPHLILLTDLLKGQADHFPLRSLLRSDLDTLCLRIREVEESTAHTYGKDVQMFDQYFHGAISESELRALLTQCFYMVGFIGVRLAPHHEVMWSSGGGPVSLNSAEISDNIVVYVHKAFWRVLGIPDRSLLGS